MEETQKAQKMKVTKKIINESRLPFEIWISENILDFQESEALMQETVKKIALHQSPSILWLLQHSSVYTAGRLTAPEDYPSESPLPIYEVERGGKLTYHGPGQLIGYTMIDLRQSPDVRLFIRSLEEYLIQSLSLLKVTSHADPENIGIWSKNPQTGLSEKIGSIGIKIRNGIAYHGFALNVDMDLGPFKKIVPCGIKDKPVTSLRQLGHPISMDDCQATLIKNADSLFKKIFCQPT